MRESSLGEKSAGFVVFGKHCGSRKSYDGEKENISTFDGGQLEATVRNYTKRFRHNRRILSVNDAISTKSRINERKK